MMLIFSLGAAAWLAALTGAAYSHYCYRRRNDQIYEAQLGKSYTGGTW
jgi:hypothetical protein